VYVGGAFTDAGGNSNADYIARWDGNNWNALGVGLNDYVYAIAIQGNNVYVGGWFLSAGGNFESDYIARWDGLNWNPMGQLDGLVSAIVVNGSDIYVGGTFTSASAAGANYFAVYNANNNQWVGDFGANLNNVVNAIAVSGYDLYIGGAFTNAGGDPDADVVAHFDLYNFTGWEALGNGIILFDNGPYIEVRALAVSGNDLYVGGLFSSFYNSYFNFVAYWNGISWDSLDTGLSGACRSLALSGTDLFAGGDGFGFARWFGVYAEELSAGVQNLLTDGNGVLIFNSNSDSTSVSLELNNYTGLTGVFNVLMYHNQPLNLNGSILPIANHRWIIQQKGIPDHAISGSIAIKFIDLPDSSGIIDPYVVKIFYRPTPGRGQFTQLPSSFYNGSGEIFSQFTGTGEFTIGLANTIDGIISTDEYGSHVEGENMLTSEGKTWYMRSDHYFIYVGISNYSDSSEAVNFYLDNSNIGPVNFHNGYYGTQTGPNKDGLSINLPFGADYFAYVKPTYDEFRHTDQFNGWQDSVSNSFVKSYSGNVFEFAIPISSLPVSTNQYNNPLLSFNWLGFLSNGLNISSRVPLRLNPSGISNDLVWYFSSNISGFPFFSNCYTHIGPSISNFGAIDCSEFTFYPQDTTIFINRTTGEWNIEYDLFVYGGTLTFQNSGAVTVGGILTAGGTTNFSFGTSDAPLNVKYFLWQWALGGRFGMNNGHYLTFVSDPFNAYGNFQGRDVFQNVVINNPNNVYLGADMMINESLNLNSGNIYSLPYDTFYVRLNPGATILGYGTVEALVIPIPPSPSTKPKANGIENYQVTFPVGTLNGRSPVTLDFASVTNGGNLTVQAFQSVHPNSMIPNQSAQRYWSITKDNDLTFTSVDITFNYLPVDFNTAFFEDADEGTMVVGKYDSGNWTFPAILSRSPGGNNDGGSITVSGITSFSDFTFAKSEVALPVELKSFTASVEDKSVKLKWVTATEINNFGFEVERSLISDGGNNLSWEKIGFVSGSGNSNSEKSYSFTDLHPSGGSKFSYRLKQIDNNGKYIYSNVIEIELIPAVFELSQNYPNPFNPSTKIRFSIPNVGFELAQTVLKVYDVLGNEVATLVNEEKPAGIYEVEFNASKLSSGIYFYKLSAGAFTDIKKMTLIK
ncbi:T9SS type A sorting domain-containing protein, partial [Ignavibacterium sp.]|uniref:T9SS type A sorting domain-containing protein n=1 Tax=Ignavibacterium sp. TaxID=2651167 RepID=UPI0032970BB1